MNCERWQLSCRWHYLRHFFVILLVGLRKTKRNTSTVTARSQGRDLIPCSSQYDLETLTLFFDLRLYCYSYKYVGGGVKNKNQIDVTYCFITHMIGSTCFGYYYAHHQELTTIVLINTWAYRFCKDA